MGNTYMFTGFPGYLATKLLKEIADKEYPAECVYLLHLPTVKTAAHLELNQLIAEGVVNPEKVQLVEGDITNPILGLEPFLSQKLQHEVTHFFHLAALYDLAAPFVRSWQINVDGTRHVMEWLRKARRLKHFIYFSSAFVSGRREELIYENELVHDAGFKNHYEYTKYEAERIVQASIIPSTIIRPGIVVGHSITGETMKFDGPYFILNLFQRIRQSPILPYFGEGQALVNIVPQDYVIQASTFFAHHDKSIGKTYHLTDPSPYSARRIYEMFAEAFLNRHPRLTLPLTVAKAGLAVQPVRKFTGLQKQALDYFTCESEYNQDNTIADLSGTKITCPDLASYIPALVRYYEAHRKEQDKHVSIF
ncbi:SDR family oxidoreductase [Halobacillus campisalis]|uniref:SDR family oxidoreductase n=1 Tax=Halobacillus campisalis TaxID=435909 RepID=A0ABW2K799_9BACI|nr:SDR family oxidoreductase [Halobacillus campisalis]